MDHIGFYPGSFDPITNGHLDVIQRACWLFDTLHIGIGAHHEKRAMFSVAERIEMVEESLKTVDLHGATVAVVPFRGLVVDAMRKHSAPVMIRGLRDTTDYNYEMQMAGMNATMAPDTQIVFVPASPSVRHIAASLVRQVAAMGGDVSAFVPPLVHDRIKERYA
ncbi:MAG: pantetheine-phosphate adenylyltransferase [Pseudomonadota bacterium]